MATATVKPVEPVKRTVLLELTEDEAVTLMHISARSGGDPHLSRRRHTDSIGAALRRALGRDADYSTRQRILNGHLHWGSES